MATPLPPWHMQDEEQRERARSLLAFVVAGWEAGGDAKPPPEWLGALFSEVYATLAATLLAPYSLVPYSPVVAAHCRALLCEVTLTLT